MEKLLADWHGFETLAVLLVLNVLMTVGKFVFKIFDKKHDQNEQGQKTTNAKLQTLSERLERSDESMKHLDRTVVSFQNVLSSYMETTISFSSKLGASETQFTIMADRLDQVQEQIEKMPRYDDEIRKFMRAIKWLAGPDRWEELKETILKDDFR